MGHIDVDAVRKEFPILATKSNGKDFVYLDSAATSQKPVQVIDAISDYYRRYNANIHRGIYKISEEATEAYIGSKRKLAGLMHVGTWRGIVYVRNATEAINLVTRSWGAANVKKGDHILISEMEHHSNMVPWMVLAKEKGAQLDYIRMDSTAKHLDFADLEKKLEARPKIVAVTHASNVLGTINDVKRITEMAHGAGAKVLIDGAQSAPHMKVDVSDIGCDFFALSAHKMLGPTGIGALCAKEEILDSMEPFITGGDMIKSVTYSGYEWNDLPWKFEAGTPNVEGGIAFGAAIDYLNQIGMENIRDHEKELTGYALERLGKIKGLKTFGPGADDLGSRGGVIAFAVDGVHPHDVSQIFDSEGIAIRAGHHCAMPLVTERLKETALSRMSFYLYNKESEVDRAADAIQKVKKTFRLG